MKFSLTLIIFLLMEKVLAQFPSPEGTRRASQGGPALTGACRDMNDQLDHAFRCRPKDFEETSACEGERVELRCPRAEHIVILSAEFGRSRSMCSAGSATDCPMTCVSDVVKRLCDVKRKCKLSADEKTLGKPCVSKGNKYLTIVHTCVSKADARSIVANKWTFDEERCEPSTVFTGSVVPRDHEALTLKPLVDDVMAPPTSPRTTNRRVEGAWNNNPSISVHSPGEENLWKWEDDDEDEMDNMEEDKTRAVVIGDKSREVVTDNDDRFDSSSRGFDRNPGHQWNGFLPGPAQQTSSMRGSSLSTVSATTSADMSRTSTRSSSTGVRRAAGDVMPHSGSFHFMSDWIQTFHFMAENKEKLILYSVLSVCVGIIAVLLGVVTRLTCRVPTGRYAPNSSSGSGQRRFRDGKHGSNEGVDRPLTSLMSSSSPPGWRMPDSSSSIAGCDRSLGDEDVEMMSFNRLDSLHRPTGCPQVNQPAVQQNHQQLMTHHSQGRPLQHNTLTRQQQPLLAQPSPGATQHQWTQQQQQQPLQISQQQYQLSTLPLQHKHLHVEVPRSTATINRSFNGQMNAAVNRIGIPQIPNHHVNGAPSPMYANGPNYSATMPSNGKIPTMSSHNGTNYSPHSKLMSSTPQPNGKLAENGTISSIPHSLTGNSYPPPPLLSTANGIGYQGFGVSGYTLPGERLCTVHSRAPGSNFVTHSPHVSESRTRAGSLTTSLYSSVREPVEEAARTLKPLNNIICH